MCPWNRLVVVTAYVRTLLRSFRVSHYVLAQSLVIERETSHLPDVERCYVTSDTGDKLRRVRSAWLRAVLVADGAGPNVHQRHCLRERFSKFGSVRTGVQIGFRLASRLSSRGVCPDLL